MILPLYYPALVLSSSPKANPPLAEINNRSIFGHWETDVVEGRAHSGGIQTYFCDPHCPWQKGANENHNGILRRYIPKKTDVSTITQFELDSILEEINNRPRKCLQYETPFEAFNRELKCYYLNKG
jgi:IS30 family transposase